MIPVSGAPGHMPEDPDETAGSTDHAGDAYLARWARDMPLLLRFAPALEAQFTADRYASYYPVARLSLAMALGFYLSFTLIDLFTYRHYTDGWFHLTIFAGCAPSVIALLAVTYLPSRDRWYPPLAVVAIIINAVCLVALTSFETVSGRNPPQQILIMHLLYDFFLLGVRFWLAVPIALSTAFAYVGAQIMMGQQPELIYEYSFMMFATVALCSLSARLLEITERRSWLQARLLRDLSEHDALTGLVNHRALYGRCEKLLRQGDREQVNVALAMVDLDYFKAYNDHFGHLAGDNCLRAVAGALKGTARRPLDIAARPGGEEFAIVWFDVTEQWAQERAESLRLAIAELQIPHPTSPSGVVTASIGLAVQAADREVSPQSLIERADKALYAAKEGGRNQLRLSQQDEFREQGGKKSL